MVDRYTGPKAEQGASGPFHVRTRHCRFSCMWGNGQIDPERT